MQWFDVDKAGLAKLLEQKGVAFALYELVQNAWDTNATRVEVSIEPVPGRPLATVLVCDDNPGGFRDLTHSFTLFAESEKKGDPSKRGRFNLGEKLVLALCDEAEIISTTGGVSFDKDGRHTLKRRTNAGTVFKATMRLTREQLAEANAAMTLLIPPPDITTIFNGQELKRRAIAGSVHETLPTVISDVDGVLKPSRRKARITIHEPLPGETPMIYEMGIPVVETHDRWHVNVEQKVPLTFDRENVPPSYLRLVRAATLNVMATALTEEESKARWVTDAISHPDVQKEAVVSVIESRYGKDRVISDPSDPEGTKIAMSKGYTVIPAGSLPAEAWANVRRSGAALPAGQVTPSPKPFTPGGDPLKIIDRADWTVQMDQYASWAATIAANITSTRNLRVQFTKDRGWGFAGCLGKEGSGHRLTVNLAKLDLANDTRMIDFTLHELAHVKVSDHLSDAFHSECTSLGAKLTLLALTDPALVRPVFGSHYA